MTRPLILHLHAAFGDSSAARRCARVIAGLPEADHAIVSDDPAQRDAARLGRRAQVSWPRFPSLVGKPWPGRLKRLAQAMAGYDLVCTYGWGAIDAALAHTLFADVYHLAPLVHHEDTGEGSALYRRIALGRTAALVVPTRRLERIALGKWQQPRSRVHLVPDGIDTRAFAAAARRDALPGLIKHQGEHWIGALLAAPGDLDPIVAALAGLPETWHLVALGDDGREPLLAEAERLRIDDRVHAPGAVPDLARVIGLFDIVAATAANTPEWTLQAMAAARPVFADWSSDAADCLASENGPCLWPAGGGPAVAASLVALANDAVMRKRIGVANRARAEAEFDVRLTGEKGLALYRNLIGAR